MKNLYREYFHIPKDKHMSTKAFTANLILSVVSILACTFALFATSYAWFSVEVSSEMNTIQAASVFHKQTDESGTTQETAVGYTTRLAPMDEHLFHIYPGGTATTGYCKVIITYEGQEQVYYTEQIPQESYLELKINATAGAEIAFESYWGNLEYHGVDYDQRYGTTKPITATFRLRKSIRVEEGETIPGPRTPYLEYRFPQYATLEDVAAFYEIAMEDILIFNGIDDPEAIEIGDWINLPYVGEEAPLFEPTPPDIEHVVQEGETVESIALMYDISIQELIDYNQLVPEEAAPEVDENGVVIEPVDTEPVYVLLPGDILLIPFEVMSGYTASDVVPEDEVFGLEPGTGWTEPDNNWTEPDNNWTEPGFDQEEPDTGWLEPDTGWTEPDADQTEPERAPNTGVLILGNSGGEGSGQNNREEEPPEEPEIIEDGILRPAS